MIYVLVGNCLQHSSKVFYKETQKTNHKRNEEILTGNSLKGQSIILLKLIS